MSDMSPSPVYVFLFTDIEGSTLFWESQPEAMQASLARHDDILRTSIQDHGGNVFKTVGDAFYSVFPSAEAALSAAVIGQRALQAETWPQEIRLRVRMALHMGSAQARGGDYFGPTLNRVARLLAIGHGGQLLLSEAAHALVRDAPDGITFVDKGLHSLRGLQETERVWQAYHPDLESVEMLPLRSLAAANLPAETTSFIGRARELADLRRAFADSRLLTLTGSGGTGKTRLLLRLAGEQRNAAAFSDGVWLVEFARLLDPGHVISSVAAALGVRDEPQRPLQKALLDYLREKSLLLLFDNCEHVLDACSALADTILRACPGVRIIASSREGLGVAGERNYRVPSLVPEEAVALLADRAAAVRPNFALAEADYELAVTVCQRLDGIPFAVELAAARLRVLRLEEVARRLDDRFRLLTGGPRTALPRQQTLRALIDWSYDLLNEEEKAILAQLSVFAGGCTLESAEAVCAGNKGDAEDVLDQLTSLVDKSLVQPDHNESETRYRLLESVRQYSREKLAESGQGAVVRARMRIHFLEYTRYWDSQWNSSQGFEASRRLASEYDNIRQALEFSLDDPEGGEQALHFSSSLFSFWHWRGFIIEGRRYLAAVLAHPGAQDAMALRQVVLNLAGNLAKLNGDYDAAQTHYEEAFQIAKSSADEYATAGIRINLGALAQERGDYAVARAFIEQAVHHFRAAGDTSQLARALFNLSSPLIRLGDRNAAQSALEESLSLRRQMGDAMGESITLGMLGNVQKMSGDYSGAEASLRAALKLKHAFGDVGGVAYCLEILAETALLTKRPDRAAPLYAVSGILRATVDMPLTPLEQQQVGEEIAAVRIALGDAAFDEAWTYGTALSLEQAVAFATGEKPE